LITLILSKSGDVMPKIPKKLSLKIISWENAEQNILGKSDRPFRNRVSFLGSYGRMAIRPYIFTTETRFLCFGNHSGLWIKGLASLKTQKVKLCQLHF